MIKPNRAMYMHPHDVLPSAWLGHIPFAGWIVGALRPKTIVELGTHHGTSFLAFCQAIQEQGVEASAYAIDTWEGDPHAGAYGSEVYDRISSLHATKYAGFSKLMRMTFDDALSCFEDGSIDLLHIDGMHSYDAVKHDFDSWIPKLSDRSVVLFHDIFERERGFGVWKLWDEIRTRYPSHTFTHSHGLGVVAMGKNIPPEVGMLFNLPEEDRLLVKLMFERAASHVEIESEISRLQSALQHQRAVKIEEDRAGFVEMHAELRGDLAHVSSVVNSGVDKLGGELASGTMAVGESAAKNAEIASEILEFLQHVKVSMGAIESRLIESEERMESLRQSVGDLAAHGAEMDGRMEMLQKDIDSFESRDAQLQDRLGSLQHGIERILDKRWWRFWANGKGQ